MRVLAYRLQADTFGGLDKSIQRTLRSDKDRGAAMPFDRRVGGERHHVIVEISRTLRDRRSHAALRSNGSVPERAEARIKRIEKLRTRLGGEPARLKPRPGRVPPMSHAKELVRPFTTIARPMQEGLAFRSKGSIGVAGRRRGERA